METDTNADREPVSSIGRESRRWNLDHRAARIGFFRNPAEKTHITVSQIAGRDLYNFLKTYPKSDTRYPYYRDLIRFDPALRTGSRSISLLLMRSYRGPRLDTTDPEYVPTPGFIGHIEQLLAELDFGHRLGSISRNLTRDGVVYYRVHRDKSGTQITGLEFLPADTVTILSTDYLESETQADEVITEADYFVVNESAQIKSIEELEKLADDPDSSVEVLDPSEAFLISWEADDCLVEDRFGRMTLGLIGVSPLETAAFFSRVKLAAVLDYSRWLRLAMPRWFAGVDLSNLILPEEMPGATRTERLTNAIESADELFKQFQEQLYYTDDDEASPTYGQRLPPEPDDFVMHTDGVTMDQKGGASVHGDVSGHVELCDRAISAVLGIPMTMLGYDRGTTYASARITEQFMSGFGGGLIREIESSLISFLRAEFGRRGWLSSTTDWENLYLDYLVDDTARKLEEATARKAEAEKDVLVAQAVAAVWTVGGLRLREMRDVLRAHTILFSGLHDLPAGEGDEFYTAPVAGMPLTGGSLLRQAAHVHTETEPTLDARLEAALEEATVVSEQGELVIEAGLYGAHKTEIERFLAELADSVEEEGDSLELGAGPVQVDDEEGSE